MTIALVEFHPDPPIGREAAAALFAATAPRYLGVAGLVRKSYFWEEGGRRLGALYEWRSRAEGEPLYDDAWRARVTAHYGCPPRLTWLETPVVVDNVAGRIVGP